MADHGELELRSHRDSHGDLTVEDVPERGLRKMASAV